MSPAKLLMWCVIVLGGTLFSSRASAERLPTENEMVLQITDRLGLRAVVDKGQNFKRCAVGRWWVQPVTGDLVADTSAGDYRTQSFLRAALSEGVECTTNAAEPPQRRGGAVSKEKWVSMKVISPQTVADLPGSAAATVPLLTPSYRLGGDGFLDIVARVLRQKEESCEAIDASPTITDAAERKVKCEVVSEGDVVRVKLARTIKSGRVELVYKSGSTPKKILLPISSCTFVLSGPLRVLVQDTRRQRVFLQQAEEGNLRCDPLLRSLATLKLGAHLMHVKVSEQWWGSNGVPLDIEPIPKDLPLGKQEIEAHGPDGMIGILQATVVPAIRASETIHVDYDVQGAYASGPDGSGSTGRAASATQSKVYFKAAASDSDKIAVVNNGDPGDHPTGEITNSVEITLPAPVPRGVGSLGALEPPRDPHVAPLEEWRPSMGPLDEDGSEGDLVWRILSAPLSDIAVKDCVSFRRTNPSQEPDEEALSGQSAGRWGAPDCALTTPLDALTFEVHKATSAPIAPVFVLERVSVKQVMNAQNPADCEVDGVCKKVIVREPLLEARVQVASSARVESVPIPVREALYIDCSGKEQDKERKLIRNDQTRGIPNEALETGTCALVLDSKFDAYLHAFGPQALLVSVQQVGGQKVESGVVLSQKNPRYTLPQPPGERQDGKIYTVEVRLANKADSLDGAVKYRVGSFDTGLQGTAVARGEYLFVAHLRPFGRFGSGNILGDNVGLRMYVTGSLELGGIRFPASAREIKNTSQPTAFQLVAPRPGVLFTIEPWNYHTGQNALSGYGFPLSPAIQAGFQLTKISEDDVGVSFLAGGSLNVPVFDGAPSQLGTNVSVGLYYENDMRGGHYVLTTFGFKLGSLFSGSTK